MYVCTCTVSKHPACAPPLCLWLCAAMADIIVYSVSNTASAGLLRQENFVNLFRVTYVDDCGRKVDERYQRGEAPTTHNNNNTNSNSSNESANENNSKLQQ